MTLPLRWTVICTATGLVIGGIVGLIVGLSAYPPTAWFAVFELGVPAGIACGLIGLVAGLLVRAGRWLRLQRRRGGSY